MIQRSFLLLPMMAWVAVLCLQPVEVGAFLGPSQQRRPLSILEKQPLQALRYPYQYEDAVVDDTVDIETAPIYTPTFDDAETLLAKEELDEYCQHDCVNVDVLRARAGVLRRNIVENQVELQQLERQIFCCSGGMSAAAYADYEIDNPSQLLGLALSRTYTTFQASSSVLWRKLQRVKSSSGKNNQQWKGSVSHFLRSQTTSGVRIVDKLLHNQTQLAYLVNDPETASLVLHVPAILARMDRLESHIAPILERVLNNKRHLASIEPYLPQILERFDDIEPHLPWILNHIDTLAPYTGLLLQHIDELLPYAQLDDGETLSYSKKSRSSTTTTTANNNSINTTNYKYALAEQLLPHLEFYVSRLDTVGPHLPLLRPHVPKLLKHNRIAKLSPHIDRLFALGYKDDLGASANMDVLLFWFGWALRVPGLPRLFFALPGSPRIVTFLANRLPKRFVRGYCSGISCTVDGDYGVEWNKLSKASSW